MQVEISIKCCSNFLFKLTSWLNCQIIHRLNFERDLNANQVSNLNSVRNIWTWRHSSIWSFWVGVSTLIKQRVKSAYLHEPRFKCKQLLCLLRESLSRNAQTDLRCLGYCHTKEKNKWYYISGLGDKENVAAIGFLHLRFFFSFLFVVWWVIFVILFWWFNGLWELLLSDSSSVS